MLEMNIGLSQSPWRQKGENLRRRRLCENMFGFLFFRDYIYRHMMCMRKANGNAKLEN